MVVDQFCIAVSAALRRGYSLVAAVSFVSSLF